METLMRGDNIACNGRVLCRTCRRVAGSLVTAITNGWERVGVKVLIGNTGDGGFHWGKCWHCLGKAEPKP